MAQLGLKILLLSLGVTAFAAVAELDDWSTTVEARVLVGHTTDGHDHDDDDDDDDGRTAVPIDDAPDGFQVSVRQGHGSDNEDNVNFLVECPRNAWCAIGFNNAQALSMGGSGQGSDMFICADGEVKRYWVTGQIQPTSGVAVAGSTCEHTGAETHFEFTRSFDADGAQEIAIDPNKRLWVIWAMGQEDATALAYHGPGSDNRGGQHILFADYGLDEHNHGGNGGGGGSGGDSVSGAGTMAFDMVVAAGVMAVILGRVR